MSLQIFAPTLPDGSDAASLTVRQAIELYRKNLGTIDSQKAHEDRLRVWDKFVAFCGDKLVVQCRRAELVMFINAHPEWVSDWTIGRVIRTVQRPFNWCVEDLQLLDKSPFRGLHHTRGDRGRPMTEQEFHRLWKATDNRFRWVLFFLRMAGARTCELRTLEREHLHLDAHTAVLPRPKNWRQRKEHRERVLVLHPNLVKFLRWLIEKGHAGERFVFLNSRGQPWTQTALDLRLYRLRERCGIPKTCKLYGARHKWVTTLLESGAGLSTTSHLAGHGSTKMTEHYDHIYGCKEHLHQAVLKAFRPRGKPAGDRKATSKARDVSLPLFDGLPGWNQE